MAANTDSPKRPRTRRPNRSLDDRAKEAKAAEQRALDRYKQKQARAQRLEATKAARDRKLDTRRKIIAGALALEHMKADAPFKAQMMALLDRYVLKAAERELFGLDPLKGSPPEGGA